MKNLLDKSCEESNTRIAQACAITFQGNASNNLQQDAFSF